MTRVKWSERNQFANELHKAIEQRTHRQLTRLNVEVNGAEVMVEAASSNYYGVQLVLAALHELRSRHAEGPRVALQFMIGRQHRLNLDSPSRRTAFADGERIRSGDTRNFGGEATRSKTYSLTQ